MLVERTASDCLAAVIANLEMAVSASRFREIKAKSHESRFIYEGQTRAFCEAIQLIKTEFNGVES